MADEVRRLENGTVEIKLTIPWTDIDMAYNKQVEKFISGAEMPGFRKGKAPRDLIEAKIDKPSLMSQALSEILPQTYTRAVKTHDLRPILYPQIKIDQGKTGEDWVFTASTCETPAISLPDYKKEIALFTPKPGENKLQLIIDYLQKNTQVNIPDLLVEEESNHRLAGLAENLTQLGIGMAKYLETKKMSPQALKAQTAQSARSDLQLELVLNRIREEEKLADRPKTLEFLEKLIPG